MEINAAIYINLSCKAARREIGSTSNLTQILPQMADFLATSSSHEFYVGSDARTAPSVFRKSERDCPQ